MGGVGFAWGILVIICLFHFNVEQSLLVDAQLIYTSQESAAINKVRPKVANLLRLDYQKLDGYILRFIRNNNFDLGKTVQNIEKYHQWRADNNIDTILDEKLTAHGKYLPYKIDGYDKAGRPVLVISFGKWQLRKYVVAGRQADVIRVYRQMLEKTIVKTFETTQRTGKDIDEIYAIGDLDGLSAREQICAGCVPLSLELARSFDSSIANFVVNCTLVNVPRIFQPVLSLSRAIFSLKSLNVVRDYTSDKTIWQPLLHKDIAIDQLPKSLGGTRPD